MDRAAPRSLLRSFERHLRAQNRSERTVGNYLESARLAEAFLGGRGKRLEEATQADLEDFLADILRRRSASTAATRYKVLRILYRWLEEEEELPSPMARIRPPIVPEQPVPIVPEDGLRRLLAACAGKGFEARRDTAIVMLLLDTGARRSELAELQLTHVDLDLGLLGRRLLNVCVKFSEDEVESGVRSTSADTSSDQPLSEWPAGRDIDRTSAQRTAAVGLTDRGSLVEFALMADRHCGLPMTVVRELGGPRLASLGGRDEIAAGDGRAEGPPER